MNAQKITLTEAASFLGVSKATLRNWDKANKLTAARNPHNSYRMYNLDELIKLKGDRGTEQIVRESKTKNDVRQIKQILAKMQSTLRDEMSDSNIISRFDEISKLLFLAFYTKSTELFFDDTELFASETAEEFSRRVQSIYSNLIQEHKLCVPKTFEKINLPPNVLLKCVSLLNKIDFSDDGCDVKGLAYEEMLKGTFDKNAHQQFFTPYQIVDFMIKAMKPFLAGNICDPACGTGGFLIKAANVAGGAKVIGIEIDERLAWVSTLNLLSHKADNFEVKCFKTGGSLGDDAQKYFGTIDAILTNPPFGSDYSDQNILQNFTLGKNKVSRRRGILFIEQSYNLLKRNGTVAIIIDRGVLNSKQNSDVQEFILEHFSILAIVDLPETAFMPYASVLSSILILQKKTKKANGVKTFFANADKIGRKPNGEDDLIYHADGTKELDSDFEKILAGWNNYLNNKPVADTKNYFVADIHSNVKERGTPRLDYVFHHPLRKESERLLRTSTYQLLTLADICSEHNETYIPAVDFDSSSILFTGLANIEAYTGVATQMESATTSIKSAVKRYEQGEILFSKMRPNLRKVALMDFENGGYASSECIVLSVRKNSAGEFIMDPQLLSILLRSDFVYGQIMGLVVGIGRPRVSGRDLWSIKIPVPPLKVQKQALDVMKNADETSTSMRKKAASLQEEAANIEHLAVSDITKIVSGAEL